MEAPERIYCESDGIGNIVKVHNIKWPDDEAENIEYISTDAFIEKAIKYIANHFLAPGMDNEIKDFVNYMEGE